MFGFTTYMFVLSVIFCAVSFGLGVLYEKLKGYETDDDRYNKKVIRRNKTIEGNPGLVKELEK